VQSQGLQHHQYNIDVLQKRLISNEVRKNSPRIKQVGVFSDTDLLNFSPDLVCAGRDVLEGDTFIDPNIARHAQHALGDNILHHFVCTTSDAQARRTEIAL
jgi:hypothetical protein